VRKRRVTRCLSRVAMIVSSHVEGVVLAGLPEHMRIVNNGQIYASRAAILDRDSMDLCDIPDIKLAGTHGRRKSSEDWEPHLKENKVNSTRFVIYFGSLTHK
jgi:hypothetical protein